MVYTVYIWISKHVRSFLGTFLKSLSEMNIDGIYGFLNMSGVDFLALLHFFKKLLRNEYKMSGVDDKQKT